MIFSVIDMSLWDIFNWELFALFYVVAVAAIIVPSLSDAVSMISITPFKKGRWNGLALFVLVSVIAVPHYVITANALHSEKQALLSGEYETRNVVYDGQGPDTKVAWATFPDTTLSFEGTVYEFPGSLHGTFRTEGLRERLVEGDRYTLHVKDGVLLQLSKPIN